MLCENGRLWAIFRRVTVNIFAQHLHLTKRLPLAAWNILHGIPVACDVGAFSE